MKILVDSIDKLPYLPEQIIHLYLDMETTSGSEKYWSTNPFSEHCKILGIAFTWDKHEHGYYIPLRHRQPADESRNLPLAPVYQFLYKLLRRSRIWRNPNLKYDAHVIERETGYDIIGSKITLECTTTLAKIWDSDRLEYSLTALCRDVIFKDVSHFEFKFQPYLRDNRGIFNRDYGAIPLDFMYPYACEDVLSGREVHVELLNQIDEGCKKCWEMEKKVTRALYEVEREGLKIDGKLVVEDVVRLNETINRKQVEIRELTGIRVHAHKSADCLALFCNHYGLPVVEWTDAEPPNPSFGKEAMKEYKVIAQQWGDEQLERVVDLVAECKEDYKLMTSFALPYLELATEKGLRLHGSFNQAVRTARLSMKEPNMQQVPPRAKEYLVPDDGEIFIEYDLSQIEYRFIAHYLKNNAILKAYQENPNADFHQVMADLCEINRKPAKNMNFAVSFGAGKKKTILMLKDAFDPSMVPQGEDFNDYCETRGREIFDTYHKRIPELKQKTWEASNLVRQRGYIRNLFGRLRRLPRRFHYKAFNAAVQSGAADLMKAITVHLSEEFKQHKRPPRILAIVHDSWLVSVKKEDAEFWYAEIKRIIEETPHPLCVPVYCSGGWSEKNWRDCENDKEPPRFQCTLQSEHKQVQQTAI